MSIDNRKVICISFTYHISIQFDFYRTHLTYCSSQSTPDFMWQVWCFTLPMLQRRVCQQVLGAIYQRRAGEQINREAFASWWTQYKHINWYKHYDMTWHDIKVWVSDLVEIWQCTATIAPYIALYIYSTSVAEKKQQHIQVSRRAIAISGHASVSSTFPCQFVSWLIRLTYSRLVRLTNSWSVILLSLLSLNISVQQSSLMSSLWRLNARKCIWRLKCLKMYMKA